VKTRTSKALGAAAGIAALAASLPLAITAYADPEPAPAPTTPTTTSSIEAPIPDPQGSGCDAFKSALPTWKNFATQPVGQVFLRLLFMLVIPLILSALSLGVAGLGDLRSLGRIGFKTLAYTVTVSNKNSAACGSSSFALAQALP